MGGWWQVGRGHRVRRHKSVSLGGEGALFGTWGVLGVVQFCAGFFQLFCILGGPASVACCGVLLGAGQQGEGICDLGAGEGRRSYGLCGEAGGGAHLNQEGHGAGGGGSVHLGALEDGVWGSVRAKLFP